MQSMSVKSLDWYLIFFVFSVNLLQPSLCFILLCKNHTECPAEIPYCCAAHILGTCKERCNGVPCKSDKGCASDECCNNKSVCTYKRCRDQCSTNKDCPKGKFCCINDNDFNVCDDSCYGQHCITYGDCPGKECCKNGRCHGPNVCKHPGLSIAALIVIVAASILAIFAVVFCVMACCGCFKQSLSGGVIENSPPEYEEQIATPDYVQLEDMTVNEPIGE